MGLFGLCLALSACLGLGEGTPPEGMSQQQVSQVQKAASSLPDLRPGDRFTYDNPDVTWEVAAIVEEGRIAWRSSGGESQITDANPLLPALEWSSPDRGNGKRLITEMTGEMFPIKPGSEISFRSTVDTDVPPYAWEYDWQCKTGGMETAMVPAGTFMVYRIGCGREAPDEVTFLYAPEVGNYVTLIARDSAGGPPVIRRLQSYHRDGQQNAMMPNATAVPPQGQVVMEAEQPDQMGLQDGTAPPTGPKPLGMLAGIPQPEEGTVPSMQATPATPPQSGMTPEATASQSVAQTGEAVAPGSIGLHLASYKDEAHAEAGWKVLMNGNRDQLQGLRPIIRRVDLGSKGIFYRLHAGPVGTEAQATAICKTLSQRGVYCKAMTL
jgi:hypothetical protein